MCQTLVRFVERHARLDCALSLLRQLTLCYVIENGDAHLKNFGLLYDDPADARLSPAYDLLTTTCFPSLIHDRPALTLGGRKVWDAFGELERFFSRTLSVPLPAIHQTFADVLHGVHETATKFPEMHARFPEATDVLTSAEQAWARGTARLETHLSRSTIKR